MNFFLWGHIKALVYTSPVDSDADLIACTVEEAATLKQQPDILGGTRFCWLCIEVGGRTFEHLLKTGKK